MQTIESEKERLLWKEAKKRVDFRNHLLTYLVINAFLWILWVMGKGDQGPGIPWPLFCTLGWGFGLFWHFVSVFVMQSKSSQVEKEYERLRRERGL